MSIKNKKFLQYLIYFLWFVTKSTSYCVHESVLWANHEIWSVENDATHDRQKLSCCMLCMVSTTDSVLKIFLTVGLIFLQNSDNTNKPNFCTHPKWKLYTVYNRIYYTWDKNTCTFKCRKWNQSCVGMLNFYQLGSKFIKKIQQKKA